MSLTSPVGTAKVRRFFGFLSPMPIGESSREMFLGITLNAAFNIACRAAQHAGGLHEASPGSNTLVVKTSYGFQSVKLRVSLRPHTGGTVLTIQGASDDVWGGGARKGIDKFLAALNPLVIDAMKREPPMLSAVGNLPPILADSPKDETLSVEARLERLSALRQKGLISDEEFTSKRQAMINEL